MNSVRISTKQFDPLAIIIAIIKHINKSFLHNNNNNNNILYTEYRNAYHIM